MISEFVVIAGMSGAGRSSVADTLEDLGWFVVDNLPPALVDRIAELAEAPGSTYDRVALVIGSGSDPSEVTGAIGALKARDSRVTVLFLDASDEVLVRRYEDTRRRHPRGEEGSRVAEAIVAERDALGPERAEADKVIDTTELNVHQLRDRILAEFGGDGGAAGMQIAVQSFGYKHGLPLDVDLVLDVRFLPNPHWIDELRPLTGQDSAVQDYVLEQRASRTFLRHLERLLEFLVPLYASEGKAYLTIALGCTGGRHRSVVIAEQVALILSGQGHEPAVTHRDIDR